MGELIRVEKVQVTYAAGGGAPHRVLDSVNLTIQPGEFISVVGQTGCGKSTLLRLLLGAERPTSGRVFIEGLEIYHPNRDRGYVPQKYSLFPDKTVLGNICFGPEIEYCSFGRMFRPAFRRKRREIQTEAMAWLAMMGLREADAAKYPDQLSGGMQQRVAIAQALIMKPKILLMDEAFSALDPSTRADMQRLLRRVWDETGTTVLFVTHNIAEAIVLGTRVVVLGKDKTAPGSRVQLDLPVPDYVRTSNGYPQPEELARLIRVIEDHAMGGRLEQELAEFGG